MTPARVIRLLIGAAELYEAEARTGAGMTRDLAMSLAADYRAAIATVFRLALAAAENEEFSPGRSAPEADRLSP